VNALEDAQFRTVPGHAAGQASIGSCDNPMMMACRGRPLDCDVVTSPSFIGPQ
jgi:hypothetical protein